MSSRIFSTTLVTTVLGAAAVLSFAADRPSSPPPPSRGIVPAARGASSATPAPTTRESDRERYAVITEHNIFLKNRRVPSAPSTGSSRPMTEIERLRQTPEANFVLTGVVFEDEQFRAFLEDIKGGKVLRLSVGDPIASGKIVAIDIDAIAYESAGKQTWIGVGTTLTGIPYSSFASSSSSSSSSSAASASSGGAAPSTPLPDANNPNLSIEEKMKLRRAQEIKK
ncbi:MAG TPA: hypothetical protein VH475_09275 [Tepidisphaeraceae bacterium]|jgi:hypothetical protein